VTYRDAKHVAHAQRILRATLGRRGAYCISAEALSGYAHVPIIRLRYPGGELTHHVDETTSILLWVLEFVHELRDGRRPKLPTPEYWEPPWQPDYRWTLLAWEASMDPPAVAHAAKAVSK